MTIYLDDEDCLTFLALLAHVASKRALQVRTYCLMGNHYHVVCRTEEPNLSLAVRDLNGEYAQYFNRRHRRSGHLFQGRFNAQVVEQEGYLREVCRYVALNPVRGGLVSRPEVWRWSAHRALAGIDPEPRFLTSDFLLMEFLERDLRAARARYVEFVEAAMSDGCSSTVPFEDDIRIVGSGGFVAAFEARLTAASPEVPKRERLLARPPLEILLAGTPERVQLNARILTARDTYGYTLDEIARFIGLSRTAVSGRLNEARKSPVQHT